MPTLYLIPDFLVESVNIYYNIESQHTNEVIRCQTVRPRQWDYYPSNGGTFSSPHSRNIFYQQSSVLSPAGQQDNITEDICRLSPVSQCEAVFLLEGLQCLTCYCRLVVGGGWCWWAFVYLSLACCLPAACCPAGSGWLCITFCQNIVFCSTKNIILVLILLLAVRTVRFTEDSNQQ